jgi:hypothetical protein
MEKSKTIQRFNKGPQSVDSNFAKIEVDTFAQENAPIKRVVLYKHGIALFEREVNLVAGDSSVPLLFHKDEIDSVLKSLTVVDESKEGVIKSVSYESEVSLVPLIRKRPLIGDQVYNIEKLLFHLRGVHVGLEIEGSSEKVDGICVGIEKNTREVILNNANGPSHVHNSVFTEVTILSNDNMLKSYSLEKVKNVLILNSTVAREVNEALRKSFLARQQEPEDPRRELTVFLAGQDARKVRISYVISFPSWNATYRATVAGDAGLKIECWGMVNNAREEDWVDASVVLVSGQTLGAGTAPSHTPQPQQQQQQRSLFLSTNTPDQQHYIYKVAQPVTVKATQSALVPVFKEAIASRRVGLINASSNSYPLMAMFMKNTTNKPFPSGTISLIDNDIVIGNGNLPGLKPNDTLLLPYAVDTSCVYSTFVNGQHKYVNSIELREGNIVTTRQLARDTTYTIENKALEGEVEVIIEHSKYSELLGPKPFEEVNGLYRYSVKVPAGKTESLTIKELGTHIHTMCVDLNTKRKTIYKWLEDKVITQNIVTLLEPALSIIERSEKLSKELEAITKQLDEVMADGVRILGNLESMSEALQTASELTNRWVTMIIQLEETFLQLRNQIRDMTQSATLLEEEFNALIETLKVEKTPINQGLEATLDLNASKYGGSGSIFAKGAKAAPFQRYKDYIQNVGDNLGAVYRARTGKSSAAYDPFSAGSSPQYQQVQSYLQNRSHNNNNSMYNAPNSYNASPNFTLPSVSPPLPSYGTATSVNPFNALPPQAQQANPFGTMPPQAQQAVQQQKPSSFTFGSTVTSSPPPQPAFGTGSTGGFSFGGVPTPPSTIAVRSRTTVASPSSAPPKAPIATDDENI